MMIYFIPAFIIFMLPSFFNESGLFIIEELKTKLNIIMDNKILAITSMIIIIGVIVSITYYISCRICQYKEV